MRYTIIEVVILAGEYMNRIEVFPFSVVLVISVEVTRLRSQSSVVAFVLHDDVS
jgi:hypothetical protein